MRISLRKIEKVMERACRGIIALNRPSDHRVLSYARLHGVDSVAAAYSLGKGDGASMVAERVLERLTDFGRAQAVNDALHMVRQLTQEEFDSLMRRYYDGAH